MRHLKTPETLVIAPPMSKELHGIKLFDCARLHAAISTNACARNYEDARYDSCVDCAIGAVLQRQPGPTAASEANTKNVQRDNLARRAALCASGGSASALPCVRCGHTAASKRRLVGRMRFVRKCLCVSCYNREREVLRGANAKGVRPQKWSHLRPASIQLEKDGKHWEVSIGLCSGAMEAQRVAERRWPRTKMVAVRFDEELLSF
ncbi:conserved hypothetical protein [Burkholderia sp. 8Y]|nr:conserved hypothetical protein [Burkholderia sp. 8Y]